jgi:hypothetical protein
MTAPRGAQIKHWMFRDLVLFEKVDEPWQSGNWPLAAPDMM